MGRRERVVFGFVVFGFLLVVDFLRVWFLVRKVYRTFVGGVSD